MEIFDIVNENDEVIGQATRDECHRQSDLIHRTVHFTLIDRKTKKILITQRAFNLKIDAGKICFLGEHVITGEIYQKALERGVKEELGFRPKVFTERGHHLFRLPKQTEFSRFYIIDWNGEIINPCKEELVRIEWVSLKELRFERDYSDTTRYWIKAINWESILK